MCEQTLYTNFEQTLNNKLCINASLGTYLDEVSFWMIRTSVKLRKNWTIPRACDELNWIERSKLCQVEFVNSAFRLKAGNLIQVVESKLSFAIQTLDIHKNETTKKSLDGFARSESCSLQTVRWKASKFSIRAAQRTNPTDAHTLVCILFMPNFWLCRCW